MAAATVLTGLLSGAAGAVLTLLLHLVQHVAFGYSENTFLRGVERASDPRRVLAVLAGGVIAATGWWLLRRRVDSDQVSVTRALRAPRPALPVRATTADAVLQIVVVGSGASLGREGAPRQVGASLAARLAGRLGVTAAQRRTLLACGAGAGLAAVYNVPLGGALFTLEVLLVSRAPRDALCALVTSGIATVVAWPVLSDSTTYSLPAVRLHWPVLAWAVPAGAVAGLFGVGFSRLMTVARTRAASGRAMLVTIPAVFAVLGALAIAYPALLGNGKGQAELALTGTVSVGTAAALVLLKPLATAACLNSGAIGGLLTPAFSTGAAFGLVTGHWWAQVAAGSGPAEYAVVGAAALLAVTMRAPVTALALTLEFVGTGGELLAAMVPAVVVAVVVAVRADPSSAPQWWRRRRRGASAGQ